MTWSRFDDAYDEHEKVQENWHAFPPNPVGLHVMATTACNRWLSDGVIRPRWITEKLPKPSDRKRLLTHMVETGLLDFLQAGVRVTLTDNAGNDIEIGPFPEDRFIVHDFLDRHDSSVMVKNRREADAKRKAASRNGGKKSGVQAASEECPPGHGADSGGSPAHAGAREPAPASRPDPPQPFQGPPNPPPSAGGGDAEEPPKNSRAHGTNPRALVAAEPTELQRWREWAETHMPTIPAAFAGQAAQMIDRLGQEVTPESVTARLAATWPHVLEASEAAGLTNHKDHNEKEKAA